MKRARQAPLAGVEVHAHHGVVVASPAMKKVMALLEQLAPSPLSILLIGETGTGKDILARALHAASPRSAGPFVAISCAALPEQLVEAELFGYERGAFTGAVGARPGLLETASGGTAFLDEIGELPLPQQGKLLRALEAGEIFRIGARKPTRINVRFVAATNRDLALEADRGNFRSDLYYRLAGMKIAIPPLRERPEDILPLTRHFAARAAEMMGRPPPVFSKAALTRLERHPFPGNIRELRNVVERAVALAGPNPIEPEHLHLELPPTGISSRAHRATEGTERHRIVDALVRCGGNQTRAAALLGISRRTLVNRLVEYGIPRPRRKRRPN